MWVVFSLIAFSIAISLWLFWRSLRNCANNSQTSFNFKKYSTQEDLRELSNRVAFLEGYALGIDAIKKNKKEK